MLVRNGLPRRVEPHGPCGVALDCRVREHPLDRLVRGDRFAELLAPLAVLDGELEEMLARAHGSSGERDAPDIEGTECRAEARADLPAENVRLGDLAVFADELPG